MEAAQIRNMAADSQIDNKRLAKGQHNEAARISEHEPVESAADITREIAADFINEKPSLQRHEQAIENQLREKQDEMLWLGRTEKQAEEERILRRNPELEEEPGFVGEQPYKEALDKELKRIEKQEHPERVSSQSNRGKQYERHDLGAQIEEGRDKEDIEQPESKGKKHQHKKLSSKQLQKHQQELQESENVHMSQQRPDLEPQSPSSSSGDSADKENRFEQRGRSDIGDIAHKQLAHTEPYHKKQRERTSEGEEKHLFAQERKHQNLKDQQAAKGLTDEREGRQKVRHHPKPDREAGRAPTPPSTTSSSNSDSDEATHGERHELVNKNLHRDHPKNQETIHRGGKFGKLQDAQERMTHLPTKNKQSEDDKHMSTSIGSQLPLKQEARPIEQKQASKLTPSQKKDFAPPQ